jgi:hypothetical protein
MVEGAGGAVHPDGWRPVRQGGGAALGCGKLLKRLDWHREVFAPSGIGDADVPADPSAMAGLIHRDEFRKLQGLFGAGKFPSAIIKFRATSTHKIKEVPLHDLHHHCFDV